MTFRQKILKWTYPVLTLMGRVTGIGHSSISSRKEAITSFYELSAQMNDGSIYDFSVLKNKKVLIINTASDCGYTNQYEGLQNLYESNRFKLQLLAFPSNDFKEQEKLSDKDIASFCKLNYGITFPLMKKSIVKKFPHQNEVFKWLSEKNRNGWNDKAPTWNFCKYLVDEKGNLTHIFEAAEEPSGKKIQNALSENI